MTTTHALEFGVLPAATIGTVLALGYTATEITSFTVAMAALFTAAGAVIVNIIVAIRSTREVKENTALTREVKEVVEVVEGHVNSAASKANAENVALIKELTTMRADMAELKQIAALVAQERAMRTSAAPTHIPEPAAQTHLKEIEKNTKDTVSTLTDTMRDDKKDILNAVKEKE